MRRSGTGWVEGGYLPELSGPGTAPEGTAQSHCSGFQLQDLPQPGCPADTGCQPRLPSGPEEGTPTKLTETKHRPLDSTTYQRCRAEFPFGFQAHPPLRQFLWARTNLLQPPEGASRTEPSVRRPGESRQPQPFLGALAAAWI